MEVQSLKLEDLKDFIFLKDGDYELMVKLCKLGAFPYIEYDEEDLSFKFIGSRKAICYGRNTNKGGKI